MNSWKIVLALVLVGGAVMLGIYFLSNRDIANDSLSQAETPRELVPKSLNQAGEGAEGTEEGQKIAPVAVGTGKVTLGNFQSALAGQLNYSIGISVSTLPLTDEVSIMCTTQNLSGITEIDLNSVVDVILSTPSDLSTQFEVGQTIVIFSENVDGQLKAHTIAVDASTCD